jgi:hypothetical protein
MADSALRIRNLRRGLILASISLGMTVLLTPAMVQLRIPSYCIVLIFLGEGYAIAFFLWQIRRKDERPS